MGIDGYITLAEYAVKNNLLPNTVRRKCLRGNVPGAIKVGRDWLIPADAPYPDHRIKSGAFRSPYHGPEVTGILYAFKEKQPQVST